MEGMLAVGSNLLVDTGRKLQQKILLLLLLVPVAQAPPNIQSEGPPASGFLFLQFVLLLHLRIKKY